MKLFGNIQELISALYNDPEFIKLGKNAVEMKVPFVSRFVFGEERNAPPKRAECDMKALSELIKDAISGISDLDYLIEEIKMMRGWLVRRVFDMRQGFVPDKRVLINQIFEVVKNNSDTSQLYGIVASLLGYDKLPDRIINLRAIVDDDCSKVFLRFDVKESPNSFTIVIPKEVDLRFDAKFPTEDEEFDNYPVKPLKKYVDADILLFVNLGTYVKSDKKNIKCVCESFDKLRENIDKTLGIDIREHLKHVDDIDSVKTVDDFLAWRQLRIAQAIAESHSNPKDKGDVH